MRLTYLALLIFIAMTASADQGVSLSGAQAGVPISWTRCSALADPIASTTALTPATSANDLHNDIMAVCGAGCIVTLAPGTYDGNVVFGDSALKSGSITPSAEVLIKGTDPTNPPVIRATVGLNAAVVHAKDVTARIRLQDVVIDGRRSSQTPAAMSVCADTAPANGVCDTGTQSLSDLHGFFTRSTIGGTTQSCLYRVRVIETVENGIEVRHGATSTVESSVVTGTGCRPGACPAMTIPFDALSSAITKASQGISLTAGTGSAAVGNTVSDVTKIGIECIGEARRCVVVGNTISNSGISGVVMNDSDGTVAWNSISSIGLMFSPNTSADNVGNAIASVYGDSTRSSSFSTLIFGNTLMNSWGAGIQIDLNATLSHTSHTQVDDNTITATCHGTTRGDAAGLEIGDSTQAISSAAASRNRIGTTSCPDGFRLRNLTAFGGIGNTTMGGIEVDAVSSYLMNDTTITGNLDIDAGTSGSMTNCTLTGSVIGGGGVTRTNCP